MRHWDSRLTVTHYVADGDAQVTACGRPTVMARDYSRDWPAVTCQTCLKVRQADQRKAAQRDREATT